jgi:putative endonuclease
MPTEGRFFVYILASRKYGALYIGVTGNLPGRIYMHREEILRGHTARYHIHQLVWFEQHDDPAEAILSEKRLKTWRRAWKIELIEDSNPEWRDLFDEIVG